MTSKKAPLDIPAPKARTGQDGLAETQKQVLRRFRIVFNAVKTHFRQVEKSVGIGGAQLWALSLIQERPGIGVSDLAQAMDIHQSTASNLVKALVEQDLVMTSRSETDGRAVALHILPSAVKLIKKAPAPFSGVLPDALARLDPATLKRLDKDLSQVIALLEADERAANTPLGQL
ncbi:MAG TPA: MarR family transcriptional regulator [Aquabacterium sp.]|uniref:MarR family winged helix-turn-helix transcriptional regulator n=1 Tax=Aquabacterium sp. TaxID=1872578 RepID=UPI002E336ABC|nr:MarR family transcriptional regulator [Aquabacterium sp.]HEX5356763.1 MarR family transcriptional regulator [Aquabacterium sp.]